MNKIPHPAFALPLHACHPTPPTIHVCTGPTCSQSTTPNPKALSAALTALATTPITVHETGCLGACGAGPNLAITPTGQPPFVQKGVCSIEALRALLQQLAVPTNEPVFHGLAVQALGDARFLAGEFRAARGLFCGAAGELRDWPDLRAAALSRAAGACLRLGEPGEALRLANEAVDSDPGLPAAWRRKGRAHEACGERESALEAAKVFVRLASGRQREEGAVWVKRLERRWFWQR